MSEEFLDMIFENYEEDCNNENIKNVHKIQTNENNRINCIIVDHEKKSNASDETYLNSSTDLDNKETVAGTTSNI